MKKEEITLKNTKAEILDALNEALEREKSMSQIKYELEKEEKKQKVEKAIKVTKVNAEKQAMQAKLDEAYNQIKEMATKTVEATGGVKILGNNGSDTKA